MLTDLVWVAMRRRNDTENDTDVCNSMPYQNISMEWNGQFWSRLTSKTTAWPFLTLIDIDNSRIISALLPESRRRNCIYGSGWENIVRIVMCSRLKSNFCPNLEMKVGFSVINRASSPNYLNETIGATAGTGNEVGNCTWKIWDLVKLINRSLGILWVST
jgi:hypothetical protein